VRDVPTSLATRLATGSSKDCWLYRITTKTGTIFRQTEGDVAVTAFDGTYAPYPGFLGGTIQYGLNGQASCVWDYDQDAPTDGRVLIFSGRVGDVSRRKEGGAKIQAKGVLDQTYELILIHYIPTCAWFFCDSRCGVSEAANTYTATIIGIAADRYSFTVSGAAASRPVNVFMDGVATLTSGSRINWNMAIRGNDGPTFLTHLTVPAAVVVGDTLSILQGCLKLWDYSAGTSCTYYNNRLRFGGFPRAGSPEEAQNITYSEWPV
jgi:uncharacterized phage protein (TIGR02218 family)